MSVELRPYQQVAVDAVRHALRHGSRATLLVIPTGGGKTVCFSHIAHGALSKGKRVLIVAHRRELIRQASDKLTAAGVQHGIIAPGAEPTNDLVQVGSIQTLARRLDRLPRFDLIILDEAHHAVSGQWSLLLASQPQARVLGVTATPERADGKGLGVSCGGVFDRIVIGPIVQELVDLGYLTPCRVFAPANAPDMSAVRTRAGDYAASDLAEVMDQPVIVGDAIKHYAQYAAGLPTIAFCPTVASAQAYAEAFRAAGWRSEAAYGAMPADARDAALGGLATGAVQVLTTCDLISEGLDVPAVGCVILLRPTKSLGLHVQQVGRGLRPVPGKTHLIVLDHAGNTHRHGLPNAAHEWSLDSSKREKNAAPAAWRCNACFAMNDGPVCVECGAARPVEARATLQTERDAHRVTDGELVEVSPEEAERRNRLRSAPLRELLTGRETRADLHEIARVRGYRPGWVHRVMAERAGMAAP